MRLIRTLALAGHGVPPGGTGSIPKRRRLALAAAEGLVVAEGLAVAETSIAAEVGEVVT